MYGDDWYRDRADQFPNVALSKDYIRADALLYKFEYLVDRDFDSPLAWSLWDLFRDVLQDLRPNILQIVPNDAPQVGEILEKYGEDFRLTTAKASNPDHQRTPEWLRENAFCMDNIVGRNTTDKGMGAFATRSLKRGIVVAPLPLLHLHRRMLQMEWRESVSTMWKGDQLLLNYVFGHPQSTVLLFPYSTAVAYVNHGRPANVALRWSDRMPRPERLKEPAEKLHDDWFESGLMLEMYALRDIQTGVCSGDVEHVPYSLVSEFAHLPHVFRCFRRGDTSGLWRRVDSGLGRSRSSMVTTGSRRDLSKCGAVPPALGIGYLWSRL